MIYVVEMNEWGCGLYGGAGNLLTLVSSCNKNTRVQFICGVGYSPIGYLQVFSGRVDVTFSGFLPTQ